MQLWRQSNSGHSVIFREWVRDTDDTIIGISYWSTQSSTSGIGFRTEYFGETTGVDAARTYLGRVCKPADTDDWIRRYASDDTSSLPTRIAQPFHGMYFR